MTLIQGQEEWQMFYIILHVCHTYMYHASEDSLASSSSKGLVNDLGPGSVGSANVLSAIIRQEDLETKQNSTSSVVSQENN